VNISSSGCYVQTVAWVRLAPRTAVELVFVVKGSVVRARAEARFAESKIGLGLRFLAMEEQMQRRLDGVLASLRNATAEQAEAGKAGRSVLEVLTETATARADAALKAERPTEAVDRHGFAERPAEVQEESDAHFAGFEELGLAPEGELDSEDADAIAAMEEMEAATAGAVGVG
jgi:hypothetical protein